MLIYFFLQLISSDCADYNTPSASRSFINSLRSLKSSKSMLLFGIDSFTDFPIVSSFEDLKDKVLPFLMGEFYTNFLILILGLVGFFFFLSCTILITTCCTPRERSKPGFFTTIIWWIIFSILYLVSIIYFILSIAYAPTFINNFPKIPEIVQNSFPQIISSTNQYIRKYEENAIQFLDNVESVYPSMALLMADTETTTVQTFINHLQKLKDTIDRTSSTLNYCGEGEGKVDCSHLNNFINYFQPQFEKIVGSVIKFKEGTNTVDVYRQNLLSIPILYDFASLNWIEAQMTITKFRFEEVEKSKKSFDTNRSYVKAPLKGVNVVLLILVVAFYVFQTITFFTQSSFSRCCVISIYPISMVASVGITIVGIFATSVSCAVGDVCADSTRFVSQYFFLRNESQKYPFPLYNPNLFNSPDNDLFAAIGGEYIFNFNDIITIEKTSLDKNDELNITGNLLDFNVQDYFQDKEIYTNSQTMDELMNLYEVLGKSYSQTIYDENNDGSSILEEIRNIFEVISDVNYKYDLQIHALDMIKTYLYKPIDRNYKEEYFTESKNIYIPNLRSYTSNNQGINTSSFCCPVRQTKKIFCKDTSATFSCFSIFAHFYILSLIGFGIVLCFRRQGMLSSTYNIEDDENERRGKKKDHQSDYEPRTTDFIRTNQGASYRDQKPWTLSDASDSESRSSFTTLDMYAQSKIL